LNTFVLFCPVENCYNKKFSGFGRPGTNFRSRCWGKNNTSIRFNNSSKTGRQRSRWYKTINVCGNIFEVGVFLWDTYSMILSKQYTWGGSSELLKFRNICVVYLVISNRNICLKNWILENKLKCLL